jgi:hypothetical protein
MVDLEKARLDLKNIYLPPPPSAVDTKLWQEYYKPVRYPMLERWAKMGVRERALDQLAWALAMTLPGSSPLETMNAKPLVNIVESELYMYVLYSCRYSLAPFADGLDLALGCRL